MIFIARFQTASLAWDSNNNRFLTAFTYFDGALGRREDIMGFIINGSLAVTRVSDQPISRPAMH